MTVIKGKAIVIEGQPGATGKSTYQIAVADGYTGTEQEWLQSLHGQNGQDGAGVEISGQVSTYADLPSSAQNGDGWLVDADGLLYVYADGFPSDGSGVEFRGPPGLNGYNGRNVELQNNGTYVQWRLIGDSDWINVIAISDITGQNGKNIELQKSATAIQWRVVGDSSWTDLVQLSDLKGADGTNGSSVEIQNSGTYIQWRLVGTVPWNNIVALADLKGSTGANVELQKSSTAIQWRVAGTSTWTDLVLLSEIKGDPGTNGTNGTNGSNGSNIELQNNGTFIQWRVSGTTTWNNLVALSAITGPQGVGLSPGTPATISVTFGTATRPADTTKPYFVSVSIDATYTIAAVGTVSDVCELWIGPLNTVGATGGTRVCSWRGQLTGILTLVGAGIGLRSPLSALVPAGWYFAIRRTTTGTSAISESTYTYLT